jgi:WD40 repeat protein
MREGVSDRFHREASAIAALNHPHICTLYDVGSDYLVMEYIEGEPLRCPTSLRNIPVYAGQILEALEAAHRRGIVHRDLKPSNIMITSAGVKLLDFGLAKTKAPATEQEATATIGITAEHTVVGTPQYMAPEQIEGRPLDHRVDLFAFGCVLYEMIAGKPAFQGRSPQTIMAAVLDCDNRQFDELKAPAAFRQIVTGCLRRDPEARWQSAHDIRMALPLASPSEPAPVGPAWRRVLLWIATGLCAALAALAFVLWPRVQRPEQMRVLTILAPGDTKSIETARISPDGRFLAIVADGRLWIRPLASLAAQAVEESTEARMPFWAPNSSAVGFFAEGKLKRVSVGSTVPQTLTPAPEGNGGAWSEAGFIVYAPSGTSSLYRIPESGGPATPLTDVAANQVSHRNPTLLPSGWLMYGAYGNGEGAGVWVAQMPQKGLVTRAEQLLKGPYDVLGCAPSSEPEVCKLLFTRDRVYAQPFDFRSKRLRGSAIEVRAPGQSSTAHSISVSRNGIAVIERSEDADTAVIVLDRTGRTQKVVAPAAPQINIALSPDGTELAIARFGESLDLWLHDIRRGTVRRLTSNPAADGVPVWSPDGSRLAFASWRDGGSNLYLKEAHGSAPETRLLASNAHKYPTDWSRDGRYLMYEASTKETSWDLWVLRTDAAANGAAPEGYLRTEWNEQDGRFSPDGRWVAYSSNESGRTEVYVQSFPTGNGKWLVSSGGGTQPVWRADGREMYFLSPDGYIMASSTTLSPAVSIAEPKRLFPVEAKFSHLGAQFAVDTAGETFYVNSLVSSRRDSVTVVLNWRPDAN